MSNYILYIQIDGNDELREMYRIKVEEHNNKVDNNLYADSGFDIYISCDEPIFIPKSLHNAIDLNIKAAAYIDMNKPSGFYLYPRSSLSLTSLRLSNSVGIIDSGYRGKLKCYFDCHDDCFIYNFQRLVQICMPNLQPFKVIIIENIDILGNTLRGECGFGSTGN